MSYELPPIIKGTEQEQILALRAYLVRLAGSLDEVSATEPTAAERRTASAKAENDIKKQAASLRALIVKTADSVTEYTDRQITELSGVYLAKSDFGTFTQTLDSRIDTTARGTVESFGYTEAIEGLADRLGDSERSITVLNGQIRRGVIEDPDTHLPTLGIAISENLSFTGETVTSEGQTYYRIAPGQTFGLYTSKGWQFWINGAKAGWFSSEDGMLHVPRIVVENTMQMGDSWQISTVGGYGIRYIGA